MKKDMKPQTVGNLFRYHYSPNAKQSFKELLESDLNFAMSYWVDVYNNPELFNVFYGTEKDLPQAGGFFLAIFAVPLFGG